MIADDENDEDYTDNDENSDASDMEDSQSSRTSRKTRKNDKSTALKFAQEHPQYQTHHIRLLSETKERIPNFVGGTLPRRDKGDYEEYCRTMLTLFKPWTSCDAWLGRRAETSRWRSERPG